MTFADPEIEFRYLSLRNLFRRADVFHIHWPEVLVRGTNRAETAVRSWVVRAALRLMRWRGTAIVRTLHNLTPHEPGTALEGRLLTRLDDLTDLFVTINPVTKAPHGPTVQIPHGHYRDRFASLTHRSPTPGRLTYAGMIRPYKGVEQLLSAFGSIEDPAASLHLVGRPTDALREAIENAAAGDSRIYASFGFVPDAELVDEITSASLVVLPYEEMHNSGMLLVALSLSRPVLVPDTPTTRALSTEVGPGWVHRFTGVLDSEILEQALTASSIHPTRPPQLEDRDWTVVAARYGAAFRQASGWSV